MEPLTPADIPVIFGIVLKGDLELTAAFLMLKIEGKAVAFIAYAKLFSHMQIYEILFL